MSACQDGRATSYYPPVFVVSSQVQQQRELLPCPWTAFLPGSEKTVGASTHIQSASSWLSLSLMITEGVEGDDRALPGNHSEARRQPGNESLFVQGQRDGSDLLLMQEAQAKQPPACSLQHANKPESHLQNAFCFSLAKVNSLGKGKCLHSSCQRQGVSVSSSWCPQQEAKEVPVCSLDSC